MQVYLQGVGRRIHLERYHSSLSPLLGNCLYEFAQAVPNKGAQTGEMDRLTVLEAERSRCRPGWRLLRA